MSTTPLSSVPLSSRPVVAGVATTASEEGDSSGARPRASSASRLLKEKQVSDGADAYNAALSISAARSARTSYFLNQLLAVCGGCNAADAVEVLAVSFILPAATDDLHMSGSEKGWLGGMIFVGMMIGGWAWGALSDRYGRRRCLIWCLLINAIGGMLSAAAPSFATILICRFVSGIGVGGSVPVVFSYFSEFLSTRDRGPYMVAIACCWMVGSLFTAGLAWSVIPLSFSWHWGSGVVVHSWRVFAFFAAFPSLACALALARAPESPRWLLARGRHLEAREVLTRIYDVNWRAEMQAAQGQEHGDPAPQKWCGVCWPSTPAVRVRQYLDDQAARTQTDLEQGTPEAPASSSSSSAPASRHGSKGIHYSQLSVSAVERENMPLVTGSVASENDQAAAAAPSSPDAILDDDSAAELREAQYAALSESERWSLFIAELERLDSVPMSLEEEDDDLLPSSPNSEGAHILPASPVSDADPDEPALSRWRSRVRALAHSVWSDTRRAFDKTLSLFSRAEDRSVTWKLLATWFFLEFGYYGLTMFLPSYLAARAHADNDDNTSDSSDAGMSVYLNAVVGALSALPANIASVFTVRYYGRIRTLVASLALSGACVLVVPLLHSSTAAVVMLCVFSGVNTASWNALNISTTELYHTDRRATAFGFLVSMGRVGAMLGNVMFGDLMGDSAVVPLVITGAALVVAAVAGAWLPETKTRNLA